MRKNKKLMVLVMVLAMAFSGIAYAAWTDALYINGTVATGNLDAQFVAPNASAVDNDPAAYNVGAFSAVIGNLTGTEYINDGDNGVNDLLTVSLTNAYPGYIATIPYAIKNTGSIPLQINPATLSGVPSELAVAGWNTPIGPIAAGATDYGTLTVTVTDNAAETTNYSFQVQYDAKQL